MCFWFNDLPEHNLEFLDPRVKNKAVGFYGLQPYHSIETYKGPQQLEGLNLDCMHVDDLL